MTAACHGDLCPLVFLPCSLPRHFLCFAVSSASVAPPSALPAPLFGPIDGRTDGQSFFSVVPSSLCSPNGMGLSLSRPILKPVPQRALERGHSSLDRCRAPEKDIISVRRAAAALNSKWKKNWTLGEFGQRQIIDRTADGPESFNRSLQLRSEWAEACIVDRF